MIKLAVIVIAPMPVIYLLVLKLRSRRHNIR